MILKGHIPGVAIICDGFDESFVEFYRGFDRLISNGIPFSGSKYLY